MNGLVEIATGERSVLLRFSMLACMEFERRLMQSESTDNLRMLVNMIYAGMYGEALANDRPEPKFTDAHQVFEEITNQDNYVAVLKEVQDCYENSRWGKDLILRLQKKKDEIEQENEKKKKSTRKKST